MITWTLAVGGLFAIGVGLSPPVRAATCDQGGGLITGTWTITTAQVCTGILYTVDGSIDIGSGGSLTLIHGGLSFAKDTSHAGYELTVSAGGQLILDDSIVTTQTQAIAPYLKLALTVSGSGSGFVMRNGAMLKFPGWFNATGATISVGDSTITGFTSADLAGAGVDLDDNDDGPVITWSSTNANLYRSQVARIYENASANSGGNVSGIVEGNVTLTAASALHAYDSYIGVDYSDVLGLHNELRVDGTSSAYLFNVTIDRSQDPVEKTAWQPAYVPDPGGTIYLHRWLRATVVDSTGFPVSGATIWSILSPSATTAQYPDNGLSTTPSGTTLAYLGRSASGTDAWNRTDSNGIAVIPLYTDQVTSASLPNAFSFGNYQLSLAYGSSTASGSVYFNPYPAINWQDNNEWVTLPFSGLQVRTGPDLALMQTDYNATLTVIQNQAFTFQVLIYNLGQTTATNFSVAAFLDGNRSAQVARANGLTAITFLNETLSASGVSSVGTHALQLVVDPDNAINEGGIAQEGNNVASITLVVQPPPAGFVAILAPTAGQIVEPGSTLSVTGYARKVNAEAIEGVSLTIELRSGASVIATNQTMSGKDGFFVGAIVIPGSAQDGSYTIAVTPSASVIQPDSRAITIQKPLSFLESPVPLIGLPWWLFLILLAAVAALAIGITLYFKVYGIGKMVECGECGAFIPEDATVCPKCGVEFEKDMARCSNCQTWIPVDVKQCPECGVEFATGQLDMADYQEKMRLQYDEVVGKLREDASRQLRRSLSDQEFQEWWRKQPTFLTFEDWLREEEEMRKKGSKPCPVCGTLNSVTATVCHKCGSMMREQVPRPPKGGAGGMAPRSRPARPASAELSPSGETAEGAPAAGETGGGAVSRPMVPGAGPLVQKKVIRRPTVEDEQGEAKESDEGQSGDGEDQL